MADADLPATVSPVGSNFGSFAVQADVRRTVWQGLNFDFGVGNSSKAGAKGFGDSFFGGPTSRVACGCGARLVGFGSAVFLFCSGVHAKQKSLAKAV